MSKNIVAAILLVVGLVGGFIGGMQYQKHQTTNLSGRFTRAMRGIGSNGLAVTGSIISASDSSITVAMPDGSSKIVLLTSSTSINKSVVGLKSDLQSGVKVAVFGASNSDGSITATSIQINPMMRGATPSASVQ